MNIKLIIALLALLIAVETTWIAIERQKIQELNGLIAQLRGLVGQKGASSDQAVVEELKREYNERQATETKLKALSEDYQRKFQQGLHDFAHSPDTGNSLLTDESWIVHDATPSPTPKKKEP